MNGLNLPLISEHEGYCYGIRKYKFVCMCVCDMNETH